MMQLDGNSSIADATMADEAKTALARANFSHVTAGDIRGTGDYLHKIINLIRGCGFAVAIFSDRTPSKTLANIFFEVGLAGMLGKPVQLVLNGENPAPSDFVRSEWIPYKRGDEAAFRIALDESLTEMNALAAFYRDIGEVALEAERPDLELAFERFKQAILIGDDAKSRDGVHNVRDRLVEARDVQGRDDMATHRDRLFKSVSAFLRLLPIP